MSEFWICGNRRLEYIISSSTFIYPFFNCFVKQYIYTETQKLFYEQIKVSCWVSIKYTQQVQTIISYFAVDSGATPLYSIAFTWSPRNSRYRSAHVPFSWVVQVKHHHGAVISFRGWKLRSPCPSCSLNQRVCGHWPVLAGTHNLHHFFVWQNIPNLFTE